MANFLRIHIEQGGQAFKEIVARPANHLLTILVLAVALSLPTTLFLLSKNLLEVKGQWQSPTQITVYLAENVSQKEGTNLAKALTKVKDIASAEYISPDLGLEQLRAHSGFEQSISLLEENPLPAVILVTAIETATPNDVSMLATTIGLKSQIEEVRLDRDWLQRLQALEQVILALTVTFSLLMLIGVFLIIGNTLRLTVLSHKEEIQVMKLVGATDSFILRPYLYQGAWLGLSGAILAWFITLLVTLFLDRAVSSLAALYDSQFMLSGLRADELIILLLLASFTGLLAARLATAKHLKKLNPV
ncbi:permease-like cell division protein FtsX [Veronia pacifica]|uniref:Cell division protein FtsX n=1 Tax=Veronia pacifica TaxID=1080227 RepID=A0A1C3EJ42_9GAMM|nr:permease-like cell division protein FtsX [Veronia pacifica]ODA33257.1 cell division protein FtsX [Veronia pacifica]